MTRTAPGTAPNTTGDRRMVVVAKDDVADGVVALTLTPESGEVPEWTAGAHVDLVLDDDLIRQYSLCGDPADRRALRVAVLRESGGRGGSAHVHDVLKVGDSLTVRGPRNHFPLVDADEYLFVAGGIGITPLLPMIEAVAARAKPWRLLYGGRTRASMAFAGDLVERHGAEVTVAPQDECGLLDLAGAIDGAAGPVALYCCGPEPLLAAVEAAGAERPGVSVHVERFAPKGPVDHSDDTAFTVVTRDGTEISVGADESVLDALLDAGVDIEFSCHEGTCGTCETAVLDGVPEHHDSVLSEEEQEAGDCMMVCVSRSRSPRLVLDV